MFIKPFMIHFCVYIYCVLKTIFAYLCTNEHIFYQRFFTKHTECSSVTATIPLHTDILTKLAKVQSLILCVVHIPLFFDYAACVLGWLMHFVWCCWLCHWDLLSYIYCTELCHHWLCCIWWMIGNLCCVWILCIVLWNTTFYCIAQWQIQEFVVGGWSLLPLVPSPLSLPCHKAAPLNPARGSGGARSPNAFYAFWSKIAFHCNNLPNIVQCSIFRKVPDLLYIGFTALKIAVCQLGMHSHLDPPLVVHQSG